MSYRQPTNRMQAIRGGSVGESRRYLADVSKNGGHEPLDLVLGHGLQLGCCGAHHAAGSDLCVAYVDKGTPEVALLAAGSTVFACSFI